MRASRRHGRGLLAVTLTIAALSLPGCGGSSKPTAAVVGPFQHLNGTVTIHGEELVAGGVVGCVGAGPYHSVGAGTRVTVTDGKARVLGTTALETGTGTNIQDGQLLECTLGFRLSLLPTVPAYQITIGTAISRTFSRAALSYLAWAPDLKVGTANPPEGPPPQVPFL